MKLSFHTGTSPSAMLLHLLDEAGQVMASLCDDSRKLGFYSPRCVTCGCMCGVGGRGRGAIRRTVLTKIAHAEDNGKLGFYSPR